MTRGTFFAVALACALALFAATNLFAAHVFKGARVDLTEHQLYSLSAGTKQVLRNVSEPIDVTFYYSRTLAQEYPSLRVYAARVREMLDAYAARAGGKLRVSYVDPAPFSTEEDAAIAAGLQGAPTLAGDSIYFGLAASNALDEQSVIPFFDPERETFLEYELTRIVAELEQPSRGTVAVITSLPFETGQDGAQGLFSGGPTGLLVYQELSAAFDLEILDADFALIPPEAEILFIAHPGPLTDEQLFEIDQFILEKGRALVMVDPYSQMASAPGAFGAPAFGAEAGSNLGPLLEAWGVAYDPDMVLLDRGAAMRAGVREADRYVERPYPLWYFADESRMSPDNLVTAPLARQVRFAAGGVLEPIEGAETTFEPIIWSSPDAMMVPADRAAGQPSPADLLAGFRSSEASHVVAARVTGTLKTAYPDGLSAADDASEGLNENADAPTEEAAEDPAGTDQLSVVDQLTEGEGTILLVADSDLLDDQLYVQSDPLFGPSTSADNASFVLGAVDILAGASELVSLRARARSDRPMDRVEALRLQADTQYYEEQERLETELLVAETRLAELRAAGPEGSSGLTGPSGLSAAEEAEIDGIVELIASTRANLRSVESELRVDIDRLKGWLVFLNVWLMPLLAAGFGVWVFRARRRAADLQNAS